MTEEEFERMFANMSSDNVLSPFDICPFCLDELRRGVPEDGKCGHEAILEKYPHLRFNASDHLDEATLKDSQSRWVADHKATEACREAKRSE